MIDVYLFISFLSVLLILFLIILKSATLEQRILGLLICITLPSEILGGFLQARSINNLFIYHILVPLQYSLYAVIFYYNIESRGIKKLILLSIPVVISAALIFSLTIQQLNHYNSYAILLTSFFTCLWILIYYRQVFTQLKIVHLEREPLSWISTGLLFYSLGGFFVEGLMQNLITFSMELAKWYYYHVYLFLVGFQYTMFIIALLCRKIFNQNENKI